MSKITKINKTNLSNFRGFEINEKGQPVFESLVLNNLEIVYQTDGSLMTTDKTTGEVKRLVDVAKDSDVAVDKLFGGLNVETPSDAFQPIDTDTYTVNSVKDETINPNYDAFRDQYQVVLDIYIEPTETNRLVEKYVSKSISGIENVRLIVFKMTNNDPQNIGDGLEYRELGSTGFWITKKKIRESRTFQSVFDERKKKEDGGYTSPFDLVPDANGEISLSFEDQGIIYEKDTFYRVIICGDNVFDMKGLDNFVQDPVNGGTQFMPYIERSYREEIITTSQSTTVHFDSSTFVDFSRDATNTSILVDTGDTFSVNSIKAVNNGGVIDITTSLGSKVLYSGINHDCVTINGGVPYNTIDAAIDALNSLFAVVPLAVGGEYVPTFPTDDGVDVTGNTAEGQSPISGNLLGVGSDTSQHGARFWSSDTINSNGSHYLVRITGLGQFMLGLYSVDDGDLDEITNNTGTGHSGYLWANAFYKYNYQYGQDGPHVIGPWTTYGSRSNLTYASGWNGSTDVRFIQKVALQNNLANGDPVLFKVGITVDGYIAVWFYDEGITNDWIMTARSSYTVSAGDYGLLVKLVNGTAELVDTPEIVDLALTDTAVTIDDTNIDIFGSATGTLAGGVTVVDSTGENDGFITSDALNSIGEYYQFELNEDEEHIIGLFSESDYDVSTVQLDTADWDKGKYMFFGSRVNASEQVVATMYSNGSGSSIGNLELARPVGSTHFRVGFDAQGRATIWSSTDGINFEVSLRQTSAAPSGNYKLMWVADSDGATFETITKGQLDLAPQLYYKYIESPDGVFSYPLFASVEEAEYVDVLNGGIGEFDNRTFIDDPTGTAWKAPRTGYVNNGTVAPADTSEITWSVIATEDDNLHAPNAYPDTTVTLNEFANLNLQITPQDSSFETTIASDSSANDTVWVDELGDPIANPFSLDLNGNVVGTAPEVPNDNVTTPSQDYVLNVTRSNSYGSSTGKLTITINNLTAPVVNAVTGFTHEAGSTALADTNIMADGSVVTMDETLGDIQRLIINKTYVQDYILPSLAQAGDRFIIGNLNAGADVSSVEPSDYDFALAWEFDAAGHKSVMYRDGVEIESDYINSNTLAVYDYAIEIQGTSAWLIGCNVNAINSQVSPSYVNDPYTLFTRVEEVATIDNTAPVNISLAYTGSSTATFAETNGTPNGLSEIVVPRPDNWIQATASAHVLSFNGSTTMPTLQAGYTYRILVGDNIYDDQSTATGLHADDVIRFTADGSTEYTGMTVTRVGAPNDTGAYIEFTVPTDVPPLWWYTDHSGISQDNGLSISGSTYVTPVTGVTSEGPAVNQTGSNLFNDPATDGDGVVWGWLSIDEQLSAGERLVLDNAFMVDLTDAMPDNSGVFIGLKSGTWSENYRNNSIANATYAGARFAIYRYSASDIRIFGHITGATTIGMNLGTNGVSSNNIELAFEITSSGNNIRLMFGSSTNSSDDVSGTAYDDWSNSYKTETGDQGFGITTLDVMVLGDANVSGTAASGEMNTADVDWTGLSEIPVPTPAVTNLTSWNKAVDFSGGSEHMVQQGTNTYHTPMAMGSTSTVVAAPAAGQTVTGGHPWAAAIVFTPDNNASNQHIWNYGEGSGSTDDNIYLRQASDGNIFFGWGRSGAVNECIIWSQTDPSQWFGIYIGFNGTRLNGTDAADYNIIKDCFDIRVWEGVGATPYPSGIERSNRLTGRALVKVVDEWIDSFWVTSRLAVAVLTVIGTEKFHRWLLLL